MLMFLDPGDEATSADVNVATFTMSYGVAPGELFLAVSSADSCFELSCIFSSIEELEPPEGIGGGLVKLSYSPIGGGVNVFGTDF